jgi:acyl-CoA hydrolase
MADLLTHPDAVRRLLDGLDAPVVLVAMSPQLPVELVRALVDEARDTDRPLTLLVADLTARFDFVDHADVVERRGAGLRLVALAGAVPRHLTPFVDHLPTALWDTDRLIRTGGLAIDVVVARVSPGAEAGHAHHGDMVGFTDSALRAGARAGFEVVPGPTGHDGAGGVRLDRADVLVAGDPALRAPARPSPLTDEQLSIGRHIVDLLPDGATLQLGLGAVPDAVLRELQRRESPGDLGVHSGILPGSMQTLVTAGRLAGPHKERDPGRVVATGVLGGDPSGWDGTVLLRPVSYTHDPMLLRALSTLWAVNSAFEIDLSGQVNAEYVGGRRLSSAGGQTDFVRAAHESARGAAVLALPSRSRDGHSRIVPQLPPDHLVTTSGGDLDYVVTEHGVAELTGRSAEHRATALVAVAHPDDRAGLLAAWESTRSNTD